jgi:hypothetical protein
MQIRFIKHVLALGTLICGLGSPLSSRAVLVDAGWDLFTTVGTTYFNAMNWQGVPLGTYNFGGAIGSQSVGNTDTIMQRVNAVPDGGGSTALNLVALQLESINAPSLYLTLQSVHGGTASTGQATINADGTFNSFFDVWFDVRYGGLDGTIVQSGAMELDTSGTWSHTAPAGALKIEGVNYLLNGTDTSADFWVIGPLSHTNPDDPSHPHHDVVVTTPEPTTMIAGALLLLPFGASTLRMFRKTRTA